MRKRKRRRTSASSPRPVVVVESDDCIETSGCERQSEARARRIATPTPHAPEDCDCIETSDCERQSPPHAPEDCDSDSSLPLLVEESDSDVEEDVETDSSQDGDDEADASIDFELINRTGTSRGTRVQAAPTTVRPTIGKTLIDPTTPNIGMTAEEMRTFLKLSPPRCLLC